MLWNPLLGMHFVAFLGSTGRHSFSSSHNRVAPKLLQAAGSTAPFQRRLLDTLSSSSATKITISSLSSTSLSFEEPEDSSASPEDLLRWEKMYQEGQQSAAASASSPLMSGIELDPTNSALSQSISSPVRVISFDLDNTLWKTGATIENANDALAAFLEQNQIVQNKRAEVIMGDLFRDNKARYCPVDTETAKGPVMLTLLRKDAIQQVAQVDNGYNPEAAAQLAEGAFQAWVTARHQAIPAFLADQVVETLQALATMRATSVQHPVKIGAITDGNSNPWLVDCLAGYFDFIVNAEQVGVGKPDKRIYLEAARQVLSEPRFADLLPMDDEMVSEGQQHQENSPQTINQNDPSTWSDEFVEDLLGPYWIHIGDDFTKDIVAAKSLNMRTIWVKELVKGKIQKMEQSDMSNKQGSGKTVEDLVKEVSEAKVIQMEVGAEDYLAQALESEFADAVIDRFADLKDVLFGWNYEALTAEKQRDDFLSYMYAAEEPAAVSYSSETTQGYEEVSNSNDFKFCVYCGAKLIKEARFCSACGKPQQE